ncbi:ABC-type cobalt import ATP-binding protein cbiO 2 [Candidatus Phytoplasma australiense]|uniref:ABC-type cobalt import ATP-binding protein cbiO 2 n=2 Tax=Phytoplasma australiense TaxID=59748 RepID=B1V978_PHYAS|nr:ATP-binding cassette domain-containing protein [Candidatus Phytoplasma australiense]AGL90653.1 Putative cobalt import ATP-binding protein cbiO 2 [Strawberry lethal yellows phytoplasma (CPA) str. NZSb11]CAM11510.1 ABC-type cobalt import ATP-binding protein cbiO 2 [Candidatus Phytoplasma australiense]
MIEIKDLSFYYQNNPILQNLNLKIEKNSWVSIIGHNGSGKSTLAKILLGLLKPQTGSLTIDKKLMNEKNLPHIRPQIGIIFQNPDYQFTGMTAREDIAFGLENYNLTRQEIIAKIDKYSKMLKIDHLLDRNVSFLSGGQKQRVAIASILAMETNIIVFDEVTAFLDPQGATEIKNIIQQIQGKTLITITHDLELAAKSHQIVILHEGKLIKTMSPLSFFQNEAFLDQYNFKPPLALKLYYQLSKDSQLKLTPSLQKLKDILWEYNLKK